MRSINRLNYWNPRQKLAVWLDHVAASLILQSNLDNSIKFQEFVEFPTAFTCFTRCFKDFGLDSAIKAAANACLFAQNPATIKNPNSNKIT